MANSKVFKIEVDSKYIQDAMKKENLGYRTLAKLIGTSSDRQLRYYMKTGKMPTYVANKICQEMKLMPAKVIKGKSIWMRLGVTVPVTDEEMNEILKGYKTANYSYADDYDFDDSRSIEFLRRAIADGESYIPGCCITEEHAKG